MGLYHNVIAISNMTFIHHQKIILIESTVRISNNVPFFKHVSFSSNDIINGCETYCNMLFGIR